MSGPKSYNVSVFDKHLKSLFKIRGEVEVLWDELVKKANLDSTGKGSDDLEKLIAGRREEIEDIAGHTRDGFQGELSQQQFDAFYGRIHHHIENLTELKKLLSDHLDRLIKREEAYREYLEIKSIAEGLRDDFISIKSQTEEKIRNSDIEETEMQRKTEMLGNIEFDDRLPPFDPPSVDNLRANLLKRFDEARKRLGEVIGPDKNPSNVIKEPGKIKLIVKSENPNVNFDSKINEIRTQINEIQNHHKKAAFVKRLQSLRRKDLAILSYYLSELSEDLSREVSNQHYRKQLAALRENMKNEDFYPSLAPEIDEIEVVIQRALERHKLRKDDLANVKKRLENLRNNDQQLRTAEAGAVAERTYIKARLVSALKDLNYEAVLDAEVIDLENGDNFLLGIPGQNNYLNLRFDGQGRMLYNFLIPENNDDLSMEEMSVKLSEMEETCRAFKSVLEELKAGGLDAELKNEIPVSEKALITIPPKFRQKLSSESKRQQIAPRQKRSMKKRNPGKS